MMNNKRAREWMASLLYGLIWMVNSVAVAMADPRIPEHAAYEPPIPSPISDVKNVLAGTKVTVSGSWGDRLPAFAIDGKHDQPNDHWACENLPVWLALELPQLQDLNVIHMWTYWDGSRYYQYLIEVSTDGKEWAVVVDRRANTDPATAEGDLMFFPTTKARFVRVTFLHNSAGSKSGGHIVEIEGYAVDPKIAETVAARQRAWAAVPPGLHGAVGSTDIRYDRHIVPAVEAVQRWTGVGWRGERLNAQFLLWTATGTRQTRMKTSDLVDKDGNTIPAANVRAFYVRYVLADRQIVPDVLDTIPSLDLARQTVRPVWLVIDIPPEARPGHYSGRLNVKAAGGAALDFDIQVEVLAAMLPSPAKWKFRLDLWQCPDSVARYHHVQPWSKEHWALLDPVLRMLAEAGQKCLTIAIVHDPWSSQTYDPYESMINWIKRKDGTWNYDYSIFDQYVEFAAKCGITDSINCYSMVPWGDLIRYTDEATGDYAWLKAPAGTKEFEDVWGPFLKDFAAHLKQRGWLERTAIAMDERPPEMMRPTIALVRRVAPGMKIALAGGNHPEFKEEIEDWCVFIDPPLKPEIARERTVGKGWPTTYYVCCGPAKPNTFVFSPPAESAWLGWYAFAQDYTGLLRWAYNSWVQEPLYDTSFVRWPAGDCFMIYPGPRSSIRFERLREGIADFEKLHIVRDFLKKRATPEDGKDLDRLTKALARFTYQEVQKTPAEDVVNTARQLLLDLSRKSAAADK